AGFGAHFLPVACSHVHCCSSIVSTIFFVLLVVLNLSVTFVGIVIRPAAAVDFIRLRQCIIGSPCGAYSSPQAGCISYWSWPVCGKCYLPSLRARMHNWRERICDVHICVCLYDVCMMCVSAVGEWNQTISQG